MKESTPVARWIERSALDVNKTATRSRTIYHRARRSRSTFAILLAFASAASAHPVVIGSKKFTESYVLGEIATRALHDAGIPAEHRQGMGGTIILWEALRVGQIDAYPEYT